MLFLLWILFFETIKILYKMTIGKLLLLLLDESIRYNPGCLRYLQA